MDLVERVALQHLDHGVGGHLSAAEKATVEATRKLNDLPLAEFNKLPQDQKEFAEDLWAAKVVDVNLQRQAERRARIKSQLGSQLGRETATRRYSWRP